MTSPTKFCGFLERLFGRNAQSREDLLEAQKIERLKLVAQASIELRKMLSEGKKDTSSQEKAG